MKNGRTVLAVLVLTMGTCPVATLAAEAAAVSDGMGLGPVDGKVVQDAAGAWAFVPEAWSGQEASGPPDANGLSLLRCGTFEALLADALVRSTDLYRLWGRVTRYRGRTYLLPTYFLPLVKGRRSTQAGQEPNAPVVADRLRISPQVLARLEQEAVPAPNALETAQPVPCARLLLNRVGYVVRQGDAALFIPDAWGRNVEGPPYELLPCKALEDVEAAAWQGPEPVRLCVAGLQSEFQGRNVLLLHRATPIYGFGNFNR